jgi:CBS domain-containing protein
MNLDQLMTRSPRVCSIHDSLERAAQVMWEADCGAVPVVDDGGKAVGMITDRDICMAAYTQGRPLWQLPVGLAASRTVFCARERDSIEAVEATMRAHRIRRVPVVDDGGRPVGIVSLNDLARRAHTGHRNGTLGADAVVKTLATICSPSAGATAAE